jgi:hypothetical protein|tara:strand:+ start:1169 stop:1468 length:300 start_codon:yes stop_codon:yes gene_type:complete
MLKSDVEAMLSHPKICGYSLKLDNWWTVSIQWHSGAYCHNHLKTSRVVPCPTAEIAAWDANEDWFDFGGDTVKGWQTPQEIADFVNEISEKENTIATIK